MQQDVDSTPGAGGGQAADGTLVWGVGAVASRLGIATSTLRTWERRYGLGPSQRTEGGHRRYSEHDIDRVHLMGRLVLSGVPAQSAAQVVLSLDRNGIVAALADRLLDGGNGRRLRPASTSAEVVDSIVGAARQQNTAGLTALYGQVLRERGVTEGWTQVLVPALRIIGDLWARGEVGVEVEHLASERLTAELHSYVSAHGAAESRERPVILAGASEDLHALPLVVLEAALATRGVLAHSLGPRVPPDALVGTIDRVDPTAVFLWASIEQDRLVDDLAALAGNGRSSRVLLGGPGWSALPTPVAPWAGTLERVHDLPSAVDRLFELHVGAS